MKLTYPLVRDNTTVHRRRNSQIHWLEPAIFDSGLQYRRYSEEHGGHTELFGTAYTSSILGR